MVRGSGPLPAAMTDKKTQRLGISISKARNLLLRMVLFDAVRKLKRDTCFRCGETINTVEELSLDHKKPWLDSDDPFTTYFDLDNITFSHNSCNSRAGRKVNIFQQGTDNVSSKLIDKDVLSIRNSSETISELARKYDVGRATIRDAKYHKTWSHVG